MREPRPVASRRWQFGRQRPWVFRGSTAVPRLPVSSSLKQKSALLVRLRPISDGRKVVRPDAWALTAGLGPRMPRPGRDRGNIGWQEGSRNCDRDRSSFSLSFQLFYGQPSRDCLGCLVCPIDPAKARGTDPPEDGYERAERDSLRGLNRIGFCGW